MDKQRVIQCATVINVGEAMVVSTLQRNEIETEQKRGARSNNNRPGSCLNGLLGLLPATFCVSGVSRAPFLDPLPSTATPRNQHFSDPKNPPRTSLYNLPTNAVEPTSAKQQSASPRRGVNDEAHPSKTTPPSKSPVIAKASTTSAKYSKLPSAAEEQDAAGASERESDAETIVLPGKDGASPSKPRKVIKHEDKSDTEMDGVSLAPRKVGRDVKDGEKSALASTEDAPIAGRKKRPLDKQRVKDTSSGLSSAPASPPAHSHREQASSHRRRRSGDAHSESESESAKARSPKLTKETRKAPKTESDDEAESRKVRRPRTSDTGVDSSQAGKLHKEHRSTSGREKPSLSQTRSVSPHARSHRRSLSTQIPTRSSNGLSTKKRPAPLQPTDYHSDDSSASGSPHPRSSRLKSLVTPVTGDSTVSPAKVAPHKKHLDAHGQTLFAKACAKGEYDIAKIRLQERPEDLNYADHAGNTPLQDIVELLISAGCNLECRNDVKDTPLLDAVENGHLGVVKLKPNAEGQEPLEKVPDDLDNAEEIRAALQEAKQKMGELRRTSEDHLLHDSHDAASSHGADSPRRSPDIPGASRRGGTTLRHAAARGDQETVTRILQVKESLAAARGGHNVVMELLLALGVKSLPSEHSTPMLAAIGQENIKGETYWEIAKRREGSMWKEEEHMLKNAYDDYKKSHKDKDREQDADFKRGARGDTIMAKRRPSSPTRDNEPKKNPKAKRRSQSFGQNDDETSPKRGFPTAVISDREASPALSSKSHPAKPKRTESDVAGKLMSLKDIKGERDKHRRSSMASNNSARDAPEKAQEESAEKSRYHDRTKALKRDESRDRLSPGDGSGKRHRASDDSDAPKHSQRKRDRQKISEGDRKESIKAKKMNRELYSEDHDVSMRDAPAITLERESDDLKKKAAKEAEAAAAAAAAAEASRKKEEKQREEEEKKRQKEEAEKKQAEEEKKRQEEEARKLREKEEEEKRRLEAERLKQEERKRKEEEERKRIEEEEPAEEARRVREEEERKEQAEALRLRQEQEKELERVRLSKLPPSSEPRKREFAELFAVTQGVRYDTINPSATGRPEGREQWLLNTQVALLLGEKDLDLSRYTAWDRIPVSNIAKRVIWRLEQDRYALTEGRLYHLGEQLPDYYGGNPNTVGYRKLEQLRGDASKLFFEMDMFFVKESDFLYILPNFPHLRNIKLSICYRELPEEEYQLNLWSVPAKWKQDPDASSREGFAPRHKYYINGQYSGEDRPGHYKPSKSPFPDQRVPRRGGIVAVGPDEPDYAQLCMEQGLGHLLSEQQKLLLTNTAHLTPRSMTSNDAMDGLNREAFSPSATSPTSRVNGIHDEHGASEKPLVNGINGTATIGSH
ncbi:hypothetical protein BX600DRAFT_480054 [Xylariales sp. PMI_506]|nr:hypothetical protein BX600DRAFT_480054 [Xylariales sp. PMI_506]